MEKYLQKIEQLVQTFQLLPHPEGGFYKETYRSEAQILIENQPRNISTGIYFLLTSDIFSAFHRIKSDEMWHFYDGTCVEILYFTPEKTLKIIKLGNNFEEGQHFQAVVPANCWFASYVPAQQSFGLVGCTVAYGFDFRDFEMAKREDLQKEFPDFKEIIEKFTRI
ncbi:MAG: cupin domain-containing protein [Bacteroidetes bacterium]|nr:MAG: cupin domain-containing protein [Bacteroidota bacterium]